MQLSAVLRALQYFVLAFLCFALVFVNPASTSSSSSLLCLQTNGSDLLSHPVRRYFDEQINNNNNNIDSKTMVAATKAHLSPVVFRGTLLSVLVQRDGTVRAAFGVDQALKVDGGTQSTVGQMEVVYLQRPRMDGECVFEVNEENLKLGKQYIVYGRFLDETRTSVTATAFPIEFEKRTLKAIKRVICKGCAKSPRAEGLKNVRIAERRKLRLQCHVSGNPIPWVEWYKNGQLIDGNGRIKVRTRRRTSRLIIRQSRPQDSGVYECRAVNVVQSAPAVAKAIVIVTKKTTRKPKIKTTIPTVSSLWPTASCPNSDFCLNGGTCIFYRDVREYVCHCADGFVGMRCDYKDVRASLGGVKNMEREHNRLFITVVLLFIFLTCLNWGSVFACWICCFRKQGSQRQMAPVIKLLNFASWAKRKEMPNNRTQQLYDDGKLEVEAQKEDDIPDSRYEDLEDNAVKEPFLSSSLDLNGLNSPDDQSKQMNAGDEYSLKTFPLPGTSNPKEPK